MAVAHPPEPVRFFVAVLAADAELLPAVRDALRDEWGEIEMESGPLPFSYTEYYAKVTGPSIVRAFYGFREPFDPAELAARKVQSNAMEEELAEALDSEWPRPVNLDPGYLAPDKLVLASAKNFAHRIYLSDGIYAEITLLYRHGRFEALEWTFPDYGSGDYDAFFLELRTRLMQEREPRIAN